MKRYGGGQGVLSLEAILDGARHIHPAIIMHVLCPECDYLAKLHHEHISVAYSNALHQPGWVVGTDGGKSLIGGVNKYRSKALRLRDTRHLANDIK